MSHLIHMTIIVGVTIALWVGLIALVIYGVMIAREKWQARR